jgi:hypothetical protein
MNKIDKLSRRKFLKLGALTAGGAIFAQSSPPSPFSRYEVIELQKRDAQYRPLYQVKLNGSVVLDNCLFTDAWAYATEHIQPGDLYREWTPSNCTDWLTYDQIKQEVEATRLFVEGLV